MFQSHKHGLLFPSEGLPMSLQEHKLYNATSRCQWSASARRACLQKGDRSGSRESESTQEQAGKHVRARRPEKEQKSEDKGRPEAGALPLLSGSRASLTWWVLEPGIQEWGKGAFPHPQHCSLCNSTNPNYVDQNRTEQNRTHTWLC